MCDCGIDFLILKDIWYAAIYVVSTAFWRVTLWIAICIYSDRAFVALGFTQGRATIATDFVEVALLGQDQI